MSFITGWVDGLVSGFFAWFPFGRDGVIFFAGMVIGAIVGKFGVAAIGALILAVRVAPGDTHEHVQGKDAAPAFRPKRKPVTTAKPSGKTAAQRWIENE